MTDTVEFDVELSRVVKTYIKIRTKKEELVADHKEAVKKLDDQLDQLENILLAHCNKTGQTGGKTPYGTFTRVEKARYWPVDWQAFYDFILEHKDPALLERRVSQRNMADFLEANPDVSVPGLQIDRAYQVTVQKPRARAK